MMVMCLAGINTVDIYRLKKEDYHDGIIDIQWNGKGEGKLAASYAIGALIQGLGSVFFSMAEFKLFEVDASVVDPEAD